jgi:hypothetical protein
LRLALRVAALMTGVACAQSLDQLGTTTSLLDPQPRQPLAVARPRPLGRARSRESFAPRLDSGIDVVAGDVVSPHQQSREPTKQVVVAFHELVNIGLIVG